MKKNKRKFRPLFLLFLLIPFLVFTAFDDRDDFEIAKSLDIFHNVIREIRLFYVDEPDLPKLLTKTTEDFLSRLDPYTVYYSSEKSEDYTLMSTGAYAGIGVQCPFPDDMPDHKKSMLLISEIYDHSPAEKAGLKIGDIITKVNNISVTSQNIREVRDFFKGEAGSSVSIEINRGGKIQKRTLKREKINLPIVEHACMFENKFAYVKLTRFGNGAAKDMKDSLTSLKKTGDFAGIIIDLRNNPGGLLGEAVNIVNMFVPQGNIIVETKGRQKSSNHIYKTSGKTIYPNLPVVVLINENSASASEIVAGALQDLDRGVIIGEKSFGKGLVQIVRKMSYNTRIKLTSAKYYIPSGRCIQAIDYQHDPDKKDARMPDSLQTQFRTKNGRKVQDGGGIIPDITVTSELSTDFMKTLTAEQIIFDFVTDFVRQNPQPKTLDKQQETAIFKDFLQYAQRRLDTIQLPAEIKTDELLKSAQKQGYNKLLTRQIKELKQSLHKQTADLILQNKNNILSDLLAKIAERYAGNRAETIQRLTHDKQLFKAFDILKDPKAYGRILGNI